jgi:hypothetical protein
MKSSAIYEVVGLVKRERQLDLLFWRSGCQGRPQGRSSRPLTAVWPSSQSSAERSETKCTRASFLMSVPVTAASTKARCNLAGRHRIDPTIYSIATATMITSSNSPVRGSGVPHSKRRCSTAHHTCSRAAPRANRTAKLAGNFVDCATSSTNELPVCAPSPLWQWRVGDASPSAGSDGANRGRSGWRLGSPPLAGSAAGRCLVW